LKTEVCSWNFLLPGPRVYPYTVPPREHSRGVGIFLRWLLNFQGLPRGGCRHDPQTADHILTSCPLYHPPNGTLGLEAFDNDTVVWL